MLHRVTYIITALALLTVFAGGCNSQAAIPTQPPATATNPPTTTTPSPAQTSNLPDRVELVYFHRSNPCACMKAVGDYLQQIVIMDFSEEVDKGKLTLKMVASDDPKNTELVRQYKSPPFCLFLTEVRGETKRTYPVDQIWGLTGDKEKLAEFIKATIQKALDGNI